MKGKLFIDNKQDFTVQQISTIARPIVHKERVVWDSDQSTAKLKYVTCAQ
jgi:hypothetical protein